MLGNAMPGDNAAVARIRDKEPTIHEAQTVRPVEPVRRDLTSPIRVYMLQIGLADCEIGRSVVAMRKFIPDQNAMMPGIGHEEAPLVNGKRGWKMKSVGGTAAPGVGTFGEKVRLTENYIRGTVIVCRHAVPEKDAMVAGVRHSESPIIKEDAARGVEVIRLGIRGGQRQAQPTRSA
jgi:hypothetical protein